MEDLATFAACLWETTPLRRQALEETRRAAWQWHPGGGVVETCQRIEAFSLDGCGCPAPRRLEGLAAAEYLAGLAAGIESAVLGEYQVLGQVRAGIAPLRGRAPWLDAVIAAARQLRAEAAFTAGTGQLLDAGLALAECDSRGSILVAGGGAAGRDVARRARELGFRQVVLASRREWQGAGMSWIPFEQIAGRGRFDVVATCLGASAAELDAEALPEALLYVDLGAPPNIASGVAPVVTLDAIVGAVRQDEGDGARRAALRRRLSELLLARLDTNRDRGDAVVRMRREAEAVRAREAARIARLHPNLPAATIDVITRGLVNQLLHAPSERLRELDDPELAGRIADLFCEPGARR